MPELLALLAAFAVAVALGRPMIYLLRRWGAGQCVRDDGPRSHLSKQGTPTMGGVVILAALILACVASAPRVGSSGQTGSAGALLMVALAVGFGLIGLADDLAVIRHRRSLGLRAREKLVLQFALAAGFLYLLWRLQIVNPVILVPFASDTLVLGWGYYPAAALFIVLTSNSVNLTDGLDGLAAGLAAISAIALGVIAAAHGESPLGAACFALAGGCLGFLWYNAYPARVFMGDTGALALGGALAAAATLLKAEALLLIIGVLFYVEALSVVAQVISFRLTGKRILRMSPLHHHFELSGWPEPQVVARMWLVGGLVGWSALAAERWLRW